MSTGLGLLPVTFDWSQIAYNGSPLVVPFCKSEDLFRDSEMLTVFGVGAQANVFSGWAFNFALVAPILYYTNAW